MEFSLEIKGDDVARACSTNVIEEKPIKDIGGTSEGDR
jgi:hypothetical protein